MGVFSSLFGNTGRSQERRNDESLEKLPELSKNALVNVFRPNGQHLISGKIREYGDLSMVLERMPGQLSFVLVDEGTELRLRGLTAVGQPFEMKGTVRDSSRIQLSIRGLSVVMHEEMRSSFRLAMDVDVNLYYEDDALMQNPETCRLINISVGGACFQSEFVHAPGEIMRLKVKIDEYAPMTFLGEVIRADEYSPGVFRYGFLFAQLDEKEAESLTRMLFNAQVGNKREWKRGASGAWGA